MESYKIEKLLNSEAFKLFIDRYMLYTKNKIDFSSLTDVLKVFNDPNYTLEDFFYDRLDFINMTEEESVYWENNMEKFSYDNFFVSEKDVESGSWIKIRTKNGYELHYAKKSKRKIRHNEKIEYFLSEINKEINVKNNTNEKKINELLSNAIEHSIYSKIGLSYYEIFYKNSKTTKKYLLPYEYEIIDIEEHLGHLLNNIPNVELIEIYSSQNENEIFYLMSRGLTKIHAALLSNIKNCYISVNIEKSISDYNKLLKKLVKITKKA